MQPEDYVRIVETLSKKKSGFTRDEIVKGTKLSNGGGLTRKLLALEQCGFIRKYKTIGEVLYLYQLSDCFTLFYFQFLKNGSYSDHETWMYLLTTNTCAPHGAVWPLSDCVSLICSFERGSKAL